MTHEQNSQNSEKDNENNRFSQHDYGHGFRHGFRHGGPNMGWATSPGFHPGKLAAVAVGAAIFPPLGLAALAYFLWNSRQAHRFDGSGYAFQGGHCGHRGRGPNGMGRRGLRPTGNAAFDEHAAKVLNELAETRQAFDQHRAETRAKRDAEAFAKFQAEQKSKPDADDGKAS